MRKARAFLVVCLGILALAVAFHLGAQSAQGQGTGTIVGVTAIGANGIPFAITSNGDCYVAWNFSYPSFPYTFVYAGNVFGGGPVQTTPSTLGQIKGKYR
jgi:hypothetical protein